MQNKSDEIRKEDSKAGKILAIVIVVSALIGGVVGGVSSSLAESSSVNGFFQACQNVFYAMVPFASLTINVVVIIYASIVIGKGKKAFRAWDGETEDVIEWIEQQLSIVLTVLSVDMVCGFFFFGIGLMALDFDDPYKVFSVVKLAALFVGVIVTMIVTTLGQKETVNFEKIMNPEKKGSVYDMHFAKKWEESCDEAEKLAIYKAAYTLYKWTSASMLFLWVFCLIGMMNWNFGGVPLVVIFILQMVSTLSYCIKSIQLTKNPNGSSR